MYFVVNLICVFAGVEPIYIAALDLVILLCLSLTTSSYKSLKAYVSPICVIGIIVFVTVFYIVFLGFVFFYDYSEMAAKIMTDGMVRIVYLLVTRIIVFVVLKLMLPIFSKAMSFKIQDYLIMLVFPISMIYVFWIMLILII